MTPARRAALRKAQLASARKRRGRGKKRTSSRRTRARRIAIAAGGAGAVAAVGAGAYVARKKYKSKIAKSKRAKGKPQGKMVVLYHRTHTQNLASIQQHGLRGSNYGVGVVGHGRVHLSTQRHFGGRTVIRRYGSEVLAVKVNRHHLRPDTNEPGAPYYTVAPHQVKSVKRRKKRAKVSSNPFMARI